MALHLAVADVQGVGLDEVSHNATYNASPLEKKVAVCETRP
jgi:hypothetical protein